MRRSIRLRTLAALAALAAMIALIDGALVSCGGGGPTAPAPQAQLAGSWTGTWKVGSVVVPLNLGMVILQNGASTSGTLTYLGIQLPTTGSIDTAASTYTWQVSNEVCGSFGGSASFAGLAPKTMNGTITSSSVGCSPGGGTSTGTVVWTKAGAAATVESRPAPR